ncbi:type IV secretory pathway VirB3 family protein [Solidesulfovibrio carbinoliphilus subsp. oakridgensis]|uniref:Type IV secretory pathway VirB3 family protein n=1 Tax=Solidesulfovibrio carbinoliphilus subsp. oakridgensis TaxID=694327 RepID=G7QB62_9BACT|nr:conjugal transfer protein TrbD [Solidesulfovibrio carbinoliphilus]EHJ48804.1 type IV secretory pathway VirB3 family protein [Solidesulfovibrio carbinoliphilus subsp. oakridgensis]
MRTTPIHQALHRPNHVMGAEREVALSICLLAFLVGVGGMTWFSGMTAILLYLTGLMFARRMAKHDPLMSKVWMRHIKQQVYYAPKSSLWRKN